MDKQKAMRTLVLSLIILLSSVGIFDTATAQTGPDSLFIYRNGYQAVAWKWDRNRKQSDLPRDTLKFYTYFPNEVKLVIKFRKDQVPRGFTLTTDTEKASHDVVFGQEDWINDTTYSCFLGFLGFYGEPCKPLEGEKIKLGWTESASYGVTVKADFGELIIPDINRYLVTETSYYGFSIYDDLISLAQQYPKLLEKGTYLVADDTLPAYFIRNRDHWTGGVIFPDSNAPRKIDRIQASILCTHLKSKLDMESTLKQVLKRYPNAKKQPGIDPCYVWYQEGTLAFGFDTCRWRKKENGKYEPRKVMFIEIRHP